MTGERPPLIVFCGPPCSGKTMLAAKFHAETGLPYLAIDDILPRILPGSSFSQEDRDVAYHVLTFTAEQLLVAGHGVIVDANFGRSPHLENLEAIAENCKARLCVVECKTDVAIAIERFRERGGQHPAVDLDEERVRHLNQTYPYRSKGLVLNTSRSVDECVIEVKNQLGIAHS